MRHLDIETLHRVVARIPDRGRGISCLPAPERPLRPELDTDKIPGSSCGRQIPIRTVTGCRDARESPEGATTTASCGRRSSRRLPPSSRAKGSRPCRCGTSPAGSASPTPHRRTTSPTGQRWSSSWRGTGSSGSRRRWRPLARRAEIPSIGSAASAKPTSASRSSIRGASASCSVRSSPMTDRCRRRSPRPASGRIRSSWRRSRRSWRAGLPDAGHPPTPARSPAGPSAMARPRCGWTGRSAERHRPPRRARCSSCDTRPRSICSWAPSRRRARAGRRRSVLVRLERVTWTGSRRATGRVGGSTAGPLVGRAVFASGGEREQAVTRAGARAGPLRSHGDDSRARFGQGLAQPSGIQRAWNWRRHTTRPRAARTRPNRRVEHSRCEGVLSQSRDRFRPTGLRTAMMNPLAETYAPAPSDEQLVARALAGQRDALEELLRRHQRWLYNIALRMLQSAEDAEDATQESLTYLAGAPDEEPPDLDAMPTDERLVVEEARLSCMLGMLLCLDREQHLVFVLGELFEVSDAVAAEVLELSPDNFRQRLARARRQLADFMRGHCGLMDARNPCRCARKTRAFIRDGIVDPERLLFARAHVTRMQEVSAQGRAAFQTTIDAANAALWRDHPFVEAPDLVRKLRTVLEGPTLTALMNLS